MQSFEGTNRRGSRKTPLPSIGEAFLKNSAAATEAGDWPWKNLWCDPSDNYFTASESDESGTKAKDRRPPRIGQQQKTNKRLGKAEVADVSSKRCKQQQQRQGVSGEQQQAAASRLCRPLNYDLPPTKSRLFAPQEKSSSFIVRSKEMHTYFKLLEDELIRDFLKRDSCLRISDKYLIAMVFAYFKRAECTLKEYNRNNFFVALYLANDMEEDEEELKYEIFPWALGTNWREKFCSFLRKRDRLLRKIEYRAAVSRRCCDEIMGIEPNNAVWKRERPEHHGGAFRNYMKDPDDDGYPKGPMASVVRCTLCQQDIDHDSASPESVTWYITSGEESTDSGNDLSFSSQNKTDFNMKGLKKSLHDRVWPTTEE